jgi:hypothetical protein
MIFSYKNIPFSGLKMRALTALFSLFFKLLPLPAQVPLAHEDPDLAFYNSNSSSNLARTRWLCTNNQL